MAYTQSGANGSVVGGLALSEPEVRQPPEKIAGILRMLGPGLIWPAVLWVPGS